MPEAQPGTSTAVATKGTVTFVWLGIEGHSVGARRAPVKVRKGERLEAFLYELRSMSSDHKGGPGWSRKRVLKPWTRA
jgi:hypothetical protein